LTTAQPLLAFAVASDLHFMAWKDTGAPVEWVPRLEEALADLAALNPKFLVINGDLTNGKLRDYRLAVRTMRQLCPMPVYYTMGNHEYYGHWEPDDFPEGFGMDAAQRRFMAFTGMESIYYERRIGGFPFLFLSTERYAPDMNDAGWLSDRQLAWAEERLRESSGSGPAFVFFHQPVDGTVAESNGTCLRSDELRALLLRYPGTLLFTGHTHCRMDRDDQLLADRGVLYAGGGCLHNEASQSRWVEVYDDRIVLRIRDHIRRQWLRGWDFAWDRRALTLERIDL
jgi:3',5'-cyclic AMP phosphodiesterase CpdA